MKDYKFILIVLVIALFGASWIFMQSTCKVDAPKSIAEIPIPEEIVAPAEILLVEDPPTTQDYIFEKQVFEFDNIFDFRKAQLSNYGKEVLNELAQRIDENSRVMVIGHTDYLGSNKFNRKLSKKRADAVVNHLATKVHADFTSIGVGSLIPSGKTEDCRDIKHKTSLIKCLSPDRRVEIEFVKK